jgi:tetratricopeptide (TPR) repeat protein
MSDVDADRIAKAVGDLPIAVAAAGAWLAATGEAVDGYLEQIAEHGPRVLVTASDSDRRVEATWDLALQTLQRTSPPAYRLLQFCSVLAPEIALDLVYSDEMAAALGTAGSDLLTRQSLVQQINKFALIKLDQIEEGPGAERLPGARGGRANQIVVHRLVQGVVRNRMSPEDQQDARHKMHLVLAGRRPQSGVDDFASWPQFRILWPHLEASGATSCEDERVRALLIDRVRYMWLLGGLEVGQELAADLVARWEARLADPDQADDALRVHLLQLRFNQANILGDLGLFEQSKELDEAGLREQERLLGPVHPHTLLSAGGLARDLRGLGRYAEALTLDEETHASWVALLGEDNPRTLTALSNRAVSHRLLGQFRAALDLDEQVHRRRRMVLPENDRRTLEAHGNVARDLREAGRFTESIEILRSVVEIANDLLGRDSRTALDQQTNLAVSLRSAGRAGEAGTLLDRAYERLRAREGGPERPETLVCQLSRAMTLLALDRPDHARSELVAVREMYQRRLGKDHPHTIACLANLAAVERARFDKDEALRNARVSAEAFARVLDPDHPYTIAAETNLAICSAEAGDEATAVETIEAVTPRAMRVLGDDHPDALRCRANRIMIARMFGRDTSADDEAEVQHRLSLALGDTHPAMVSVQRQRLLHRTFDPHPF